MVSASKEMAVYCFDILVAHYTGDVVPPPAFEEVHFPLFVTWKKVVNGGEPRLRGCIGTLEARCLFTGFKDYALTSALRDRRFSPIQVKEIPYLECTVSLLINYELATSYLDWETVRVTVWKPFFSIQHDCKRSLFVRKLASLEIHSL
ncbi:hypothetical protein O6H91_04G074500 [Diphasiastrum complanatum]|uniref:Uncharacterized protein n=1 Tax=Diphasiastrum complanatum TaxID=34168 RepID=A0ACC2DYB2_DIPCM|nr:hypothetical protein O6H91_04G074500 [Diphasiastrum complanatum]